MQICKNSTHNHLWAIYHRIVINHYKKGRTIKRFINQFCKNEKTK